jgi:hypothetical protein
MKLFDCFKDKVKCETCKHWIDKKDAQEVKNVIWNRYHYFCPLCKVPYDEIRYNLYDFEKGYYKIIPEHRERVNEDGTKYNPKIYSRKIRIKKEE